MTGLKRLPYSSSPICKLFIQQQLLESFWAWSIRFVLCRDANLKQQDGNRCHDHVESSSRFNRIRAVCF